MWLRRAIVEIAQWNNPEKGRMYIRAEPHMLVNGNLNAIALFDVIYLAKWSRTMSPRHLATSIWVSDPIFYSNWSGQVSRVHEDAVFFTLDHYIDSVNNLINIIRRTSRCCLINTAAGRPMKEIDMMIICGYIVHTLWQSRHLNIRQRSSKERIVHFRLTDVQRVSPAKSTQTSTSNSNACLTIDHAIENFEKSAISCAFQNL